MYMYSLHMITRYYTCTSGVHNKNAKEKECEAQTH